MHATKVTSALFAIGPLYNIFYSRMTAVNAACGLDRLAVSTAQAEVAAQCAMITAALTKTIRSQFQLDWQGIHGAPHWARVQEKGLRLAEITGANADVVRLFAFLHDSRRLNDGTDPLHGTRAVDFATQLRGRVFEFAAADFELLPWLTALASMLFTPGLKNARARRAGYRGTDIMPQQRHITEVCVKE